MTLRITVLGTGYVGTAHAATMAEAGFFVLEMDIDRRREDHRTHLRKGPFLRTRYRRGVVGGGATARSREPSSDSRELQVPARASIITLSRKGLARPNCTPLR